MNHRIYFPNLDALRSIAALFVLLSHILSVYLDKYFSDAIWYTNPLTQFFIRNGGLGVQIFFTLSGFLITYLLLSEIRETNHINFRNFFIRRVLRIWPVYFLVVFFVFVVLELFKQMMNIDTPLFESPLMSVFFLSNYDLIKIMADPGMYPNGILSLTWSVSVEEQFYLIWPLLFLLVSFSRIKYAIIGVILIGFIFILYHNGDQNVIYRHTVSNFIFLGSGGLLAYLQIYKYKVLNIFMNMNKFKLLSIFLILIMLMIFTKSQLMNSPYGYPGYLFLTVLFLFYTLLLLTTEKIDVFFDLSSISWLLNIAKYTYGLYMYHRIAGFILETVFFKVMKIQSSLGTDFILMIIQFILTFFMAIMSYYFMEKPLLKLKNRFSLFHK